MAIRPEGAATPSAENALDLYTILGAGPRNCGVVFLL